MCRRWVKKLIDCGKKRDLFKEQDWIKSKQCK